jgi:1-acyl-sn-glycerol-3-phosphate acyltransferase
MTKLGLDYPTAWGRGYPARIVRNIVVGRLLAPTIRRMGSLQVFGEEHLSSGGPFIFVANHTSHLDTPIMLSALPPAVRRRTVVAAAMDNFFMNPRKAFLTVLFFNAIAFDRHKVNRRSSQLAIELIEDGWHLLLYPEGGRSPDGNLHEFKGGAGYLAERAHTPVIPTYIHDAGYLRGAKYAKAPAYTKASQFRQRPVTVTFGPPLLPEHEENVRKFGARIEEAVAALGRRVSGDAAYGVHPPDEY